MRFTDYHAGNIMIDKDLNWTNVDVDGIICYGMHEQVEDSPYLLRGDIGDLINYDHKHILNIRDNK